MNLFEEKFKVQDLHTPYFFSFKNYLFWEVSFWNDTNKVLIRDGSLSPDGEEIAGTVIERDQSHPTLQKAIQEVEQMIQKKLIAGYKLRPLPPNQKRAASDQNELNLRGEHSYKTLHTESAQNSCRGNYFEKREGDKILYRKVQISENRLKFEEGYFDEDGQIHSHMNNEVECDDEDGARRRMVCYSNGRERSGFQRVDEKFEFDFYPQNIEEETKTEIVSQDDDGFQEKSPYQAEAYEELFNLNKSKGRKAILSYRPAEWPESKDPKGFYLREKLNGIICVWDGESKFLSLLGREYNVPEEFRRGFPKMQLVGLMYFGAGESLYVSMCIRSIEMARWKNLKFIVYDTPNLHLPFAERMITLKKMIATADSRYLKMCGYMECEGQDHFEKELEKAKANNGEGVYLNDPRGALISGATGGFYLSKIYMQREALVVGYGRVLGNQGKVKSLRVRNLENGGEFSISRGVDKKVKRHLPKIGSIILFKAMGEKLKGCPKMPIYVGVKRVGVEVVENGEE